MAMNDEIINMTIGWIDAISVDDWGDLLEFHSHGDFLFIFLNFATFVFIIHKIKQSIDKCYCMVILTAEYCTVIVSKKREIRNRHFTNKIQKRTHDRLSFAYRPKRTWIWPKINEKLYNWSWRGQNKGVRYNTVPCTVSKLFHEKHPWYGKQKYKFVQISFENCEIVSHSNQ